MIVRQIFGAGHHSISNSHLSSRANTMHCHPTQSSLGFFKGWASRVSISQEMFIITVVLLNDMSIRVRKYLK